jgi:hypothetical protein
MEKLAYGTAFLPKVAANIADLNQGQFVLGCVIEFGVGLINTTFTDII